MLQCVAVWCSEARVLQCVAVCCNCVTVRCSVLQRVAVCCSDVIAYVDAVDVPLHLSVLRCVAVRRVCCRMLQGDAGCCRVLQ